MFLSRIIRATGQLASSIIRPTRLTKIFVGGDVLCFLIQAVGAAILAGSDSKKSSNLGKAVILVGLFLQIAIFGFFIVVGIVFHIRAARVSGGKLVAADFNWKGYLHQLYVVSVLITIRNAFRVIEYAMGEDGYLLATEWPIYVFDALLMAIVLAICCKWYVRDIITVHVVAQEGQEDFEMGNQDLLEPKHQAGRH
ncbi:hypothetical protein SLS60_000350 [Paraconiothyrium brasiliense]|uniref:Uncharacterized protein n=1 Tax=Paraconiothyrium brasiliense TaxID=300254 RepID=A0ABR3S670_9PLEO